MSLRFKKFPVYQDAKQFAKKCSEIIRKYVKKKNPNLASQIERAFISIVLNIAEGSAGESDADFARFLSISIKSANEVVAGFDLAKDLGLITQTIFFEVENDAKGLLKQLSSFRRKLKS